MIKDSKMDVYSVASSRPFTHGQISWDIYVYDELNELMKHALKKRINSI